MISFLRTPGVIIIKGVGGTNHEVKHGICPVAEDGNHRKDECRCHCIIREGDRMREWMSERVNEGRSERWVCDAWKGYVKDSVSQMRDIHRKKIGIRGYKQS